MNTEAQNPLTDAEVLAAVASEHCVVCDARKTSGQPFCRSDFDALPLWMRRWVSADVNGSDYADNFRAAHAHLRAVASRVVRFTSSGRRWTHHSHADLLRAGFRLCESPYTRCTGPRCGAQVAWYWTPSGRKLAVNVKDYQPHSNTCRDREHFERRRATKSQTSARRQRRTV